MVFLIWLIGFILFLIFATIGLKKEQGFVSVKDFIVLIGISLLWFFSMFFVFGAWLETYGDSIVLFGKKK